MRLRRYDFFFEPAPGRRRREANEMGVIRRREPKRVCERIRRRARWKRVPALLQTDIPVDGYAGEFGDLLAPEARRPPACCDWQTAIGRVQPFASVTQKFADLLCCRRHRSKIVNSLVLS